MKLPINCLQLSRPYHSNKNVHVDQSIYYWHFSAKYEDNKTCPFLVIQIAIKNIQCRAGVWPCSVGNAYES